MIKTDNLSVLSLRLNKSEKYINGFVKKINSTQMNIVNSLINSEEIQATAVLHLNLTNLTNLSKLINILFLNLHSVNESIYLDESSRISYAVYESSVLFDLNSSVIQINDNCSIINSSQIISNVVSISSNQNIKSNKSFVFAKFRTLKVGVCSHLFSHFFTIYK